MVGEPQIALVAPAPLARQEFAQQGVQRSLRGGFLRGSGLLRGAGAASLVRRLLRPSASASASTRDATSTVISGSPIPRAKAGVVPAPLCGRSLADTRPRNQGTAGRPPEGARAVPPRHRTRAHRAGGRRLRRAAGRFCGLRWRQPGGLESREDSPGGRCLKLALSGVRLARARLTRVTVAVQPGTRGVAPISWTPDPLGRRYPLCRNRERPPFPRRQAPPAFRRQMVELVRTGRTAEELAREFEPTAQAIRNCEPPRVSRRLHSLSLWEARADDFTDKILPGSPGTGGAPGVGAPG